MADDLKVGTAVAKITFNNAKKGDTDMGYRDHSKDEKAGGFDYCIMEVRLRKKNAPAETKEDSRIMVVDSHWDILRFVQDNMEECVGNIVKLKRMEVQDQTRAIDTATLLRQSLEPLVDVLYQTKEHKVMDKLSASLKKALLLMVMTRYESDREKACQVLGISPEKLENELELCGVAR
jgi:DNA-binding protein Fis